MAKKTPLSFLIEVQTKEAIKNLEAVEKKLDKLKDTVTITIDAGKNNDLSTLVQNIKDAAETIKNAKEAIKRDTFTSFAERVVKAAEAVDKLDKSFKELNTTIGSDDRLRNFMTGLGEVVRAARNATQNLNIGTQPKNDISKSIEQAKIEQYKLQGLLDRASSAISTGRMFGADTSTLDNLIKKMEKYKTILQELATKGEHNNMTTSQMKAQAEYRILTEEIRKAIAAQEKANAENIRARDTSQQAAQGVRAVASEEQKLAQALMQSTSEMSRQASLLSDLKSLATQYLGVWGAQQFVQNIIRIGGQLEQQRLSIGAILGDLAAGQHLFDQIKNLAVQSPFGVVELDQYTKQLSAYGFKQHELFDMTKRLADISAGAGTEVGRLALALGHVRAEGALTGYTLRQFAMNNIPMLQKLSERLTEIEGKVVSAGDIRKRVRNKEIGYEDVVAVIKDLTDEGGMFYNMQEVMSDAVNAKFKNLKDSMDIMYGEMAEGKIGDALKVIASSLMNITRHWEESLRVIGYATVAWAAYRTATASANMTLKTFGSTVNLTKTSLNAKSIALGVNTAAVKKLTADEIEEMVALKMLTREQLLNAVATKTLTVDQAELAAATFGVSRAELANIAMMKTTGLQLTGLKMKVNSLIISLRGLGAAFKTMLFNPMTWAIAAFTLITEAVMRTRQKNQELAESIENVGKKGEEGYKNISETLKKFSSGEMDTAGYKSAIDDITESIQNYAPDSSSILAQALSIEDLGDRYKYLRGELESTKEAYEKLSQARSAAENANEFTGDVLNDTFTENVEDYLKRLQKVEKAETRFYAFRTSIDKAIGRLKQDTIFSNAHEEFSTATLEKQIEIIRNNAWAQEVFSQALAESNQAAASSWNDLLTALGKAGQSFEEVKLDVGFFTQALDSKFAADWGANWKQSASSVRAALLLVTELLDKIPGMTDKVRNDLLKKIFNEEWKIKIDLDTNEVEEKLPKWMQALQDELDKTGIFLKADMSYEQIIDVMKKAYDTAQTTINKLGPIAIKAGIKLDGIKGLDIEKYKDKSPELYNALKELQSATTSKEQIDAAGKKRGIVFEGMKKDGSHKNPKKESKGEKKDTTLEQWREEFSELKAFYAEFKRWAALVGKDEALKKIQEQGLFGTMFGKDKKPIYDISEYGDALESFLKKTNASTPQRAKLQTEIKKEKSAYLADRLKEEMDKAAKEIQEYISKNADRFNLYKQIMEKTNDVSLARQALSGGRIWDDFTRELDEKLRKLTGDAVIDYDMSDYEAQKHFKEISGGYDIWKKIVELTGNNYVTALNKAADAEESVMSNAKKIEKINEKINELLADRSGIDHTAEITKLRDEINKLEGELFELLPIYEKIFGDKTYKSFNVLVSAEKTARALIDNAKEGSKDPKTGKVNYYSSFYLDEDGKHKVTLTRQQLERLKKTIDSFRKEEVKKNPFATLVKDIKELYETLKEEKASPEEKAEAWLKFADSISETSKIVGDFAGELSAMFDALGNDSLASAMDDVKAGMDSIGSIAQGFSSGGIVGGVIAAAGEAVKWIGRIAQKHDAKLDKAIQKSQREVKKLTNEYKNLSDEIERRLTGIYGGEEYDKMFENYRRQLEELEKQRQAESDKKKKDQDKIIDYDQQIKEMRDSIKYFAEDMAKDLYDIDIKSWAQQLTDAVVDAWAKGEDAAEAWHNKVLDLVKDVTKNILAQKVVEAALKPALDFITSEMTAKGGKLDEGSIKQMADLLEQAGLTSVSNIESILEALKLAGYDLSEKNKSSSSTSSIKNITESTADLLASYVNAIRADVSVIRELHTKGVDYISEVPTISITAQAQLQQLNIISENTRRNAEYANEINNLMKGLRNGVWRMPVA